MCYDGACGGCAPAEPSAGIGVAACAGKYYFFLGSRAASWRSHASVPFWAPALNLLLNRKTDPVKVHGSRCSPWTNGFAVGHVSDHRFATRWGISMAGRICAAKSCRRYWGAVSCSAGTATLRGPLLCGDCRLMRSVRPRQVPCTVQKYRQWMCNLAFCRPLRSSISGSMRRRSDAPRKGVFRGRQGRQKTRQPVRLLLP